jgi:hypothetical protein
MLIMTPGKRSQASKNEALSAQAGRFSNFLLTLACFSLFMTAASFVGSFFPAAMLAHYNAPSNWTIFSTVLINGGLAGTCLGIFCGLFCVLAYTIFQPQDRLSTAADRALDVLKAPLFILGVANGVLIAILTDSKFHRTYIWRWS